MGEGTPFEVISFNPWTRSVRAPSQTPRSWNNGDWSGAEWGEAVVVPLNVCVSAGSESECSTGSFDTWIDNRHLLAAAFAPIEDRREQIELRFRYGSREYLMFGRPRLVDPDPAWLSWVQPGGVGVSCSFVALDALVYSAELHCIEPVFLPVATDGLTVPFVTPAYVTGTLIGGEATIVNAGTAQAGLSIRIDGPVLNPIIMLIHPDGTVQTLQVNVDLSAGQWIDIDTAVQTVFLNGIQTQSLRGDTIGPFPRAAPGTNVFRFRADDYNDQGFATACWRDAWF
jgi:hypothetical protein